MHRKVFIVLYFFIWFTVGSVYGNDGRNDDRFSIKPAIPFVTSGDFSDRTFGISWEADVNGPASLLKISEKERSDWTFDHRLVLKSDGSLLFNNQLNRDPVRLFITYDIGLQGRPVSGIVDPLILEPPDSRETSSLPWWANYRFAVYMEAGAETDQGWENPLARFGPSLWFINMTESRIAALLPTLSVGLNAVYSFENPEVKGVRIEDWYSRFYLMSRHDMNFSFISSKLSNLHFTGVLQYSKDFGQIEEYNDEDLDSAFGWFTDLAYTFRWWEQSGSAKRADIFVRFSDGRIAPLLEDDRSFKFGLRMIL